MDGSTRWNNWLSVIYGGMPPLMQYCLLKYFLDRFASFKVLYTNNWVLKVHVDMLTSYGIMAVMLFGNKHLELITVAIVVLALVLNKIAVKPILINIFK